MAVRARALGMDETSFAKRHEYVTGVNDGARVAHVTDGRGREALAAWYAEQEQEPAWRAWYRWAIRSRLEPVKRVARMVKKHLEGIVTAVVTGVHNARAEGFNALLQKLKRYAQGFRNRDRFRQAIYFHLGGLDLNPDSVRT